jgi:hypothetical protein
MQINEYIDISRYMNKKARFVRASGIGPDLVAPWFGSQSADAGV